MVMEPVGHNPDVFGTIIRKDALPITLLEVAALNTDMSGSDDPDRVAADTFENTLSQDDGIGDGLIQPDQVLSVTVSEETDPFHAERLQPGRFQRQEPAGLAAVQIFIRRAGQDAADNRWMPVRTLVVQDVARPAATVAKLLIQLRPISGHRIKIQTSTADFLDLVYRAYIPLGQDDISVFRIRLG